MPPLQINLKKAKSDILVRGRGSSFSLCGIIESLVNGNDVVEKRLEWLWASTPTKMGMGNNYHTIILLYNKLIRKKKWWKWSRFSKHVLLFFTCLGAATIEAWSIRKFGLGFILWIKLAKSIFGSRLPKEGCQI